jgi:Peptide methionine sulfoxide reductase
VGVTLTRQNCPAGATFSQQRLGKSVDAYLVFSTVELCGYLLTHDTVYPEVGEAKSETPIPIRGRFRPGLIMLGTSYRSAIFYVNDEQKRIAEDTIADVNASGLWPGKVVTEVAPAGPFWEAEAEHQDYVQHFPDGYTCHFVRPHWKLPRRADAKAS